MNKQRTFRIYVDGAGQRPDGTGSGYAWVNETTGKQRIKRIDGLTNNQAEYLALLAALKKLPEGSEADIFADSQLIVNQVNGDWKIRDPKLQRLLERVHEVMDERDLTVKLTWVPRAMNLAGKLL